MQKIKQKMQIQLEHAQCMMQAQEKQMKPDDIPGSLAFLKARKKGIVWENEDYKNKMSRNESVEIYARNPWASSDDELSRELEKNQSERAGH